MTGENANQPRHKKTCIFGGLRPGNTQTGLLSSVTEGSESLKCSDIIAAISVIIIEPRHDKMFFRKFPTRPDTNRPAQPQKIARVLKFRL